ncbi:MAG: hypothetical protein N2557_02290 [Hydrogenophilus sp.]|nr:hypothetical protein [Hydrogenophilus sp.]
MLLGERVTPPEGYAPELLTPIARRPSKSVSPPPVGEDCWVGYELAWLDARGTPRQGAALLSVPADSPAIVESKSLKLYANGFYRERFASTAEVAARLGEDLSRCTRSSVVVAVAAMGEEWVGWPLEDPRWRALAERWPSGPGGARAVAADFGDPEAINLDECAKRAGWSVEERTPQSTLLQQMEGEVREQRFRLASFRSCCPVTRQPDWASFYIRVWGPPFAPESVFAYLMGFRTHAAFHEECVAQIAADFAEAGAERWLVWGRFLRRGGWEINPVRASGGDWLPQRWWFDPRQ